MKPLILSINIYDTPIIKDKTLLPNNRLNHNSCDCIEMSPDKLQEKQIALKL